MAASVDVKNLTFSWPGQPPLLDIGALSIADRERVILVGPSGSGKSTLLGLVTGILSGAKGTLQVLGRDMTRISGGEADRLRADEIVYIFQNFNLVPYLSVLENVLLPCRMSRQRATVVADGEKEAALSLLRHLGLDDAAIVQRRVIELSIGQQQRVAAARALIGAPRLVIADEPTSALDQDRKNDFLELLLAESERVGASVVFVSHDRTLMPHFSRAIDLSAINRAEGK